MCCANGEKKELNKCLNLHNAVLVIILSAGTLMLFNSLRISKIQIQNVGNVIFPNLK